MQPRAVALILPFAAVCIPMAGAHVAPPAPPSILHAPKGSQLVAPGLATLPFYSIGNPTDEEQLYLELINRARANPAAEGLRLANTTDADVLGAYAAFSVDRAMMQAEFNALPVRPPLAPNALLTNAARAHSLDQFTNAFQGHTGSTGSTLASRVNATGYGWTSLGENVFSYADSTWYGHAGFQVDWGAGGTGGMQPGRGHRMNIHGDFREVGIGVVLGSNTVGSNTVGPQLVTQDFANGSSGNAFVTGVAYYDINGNSAYDPGEGIGGVEVTVAGATQRAITTRSGGYAVPVPAVDAVRTVTFSGSNLALTTSASLPSGVNAKVDFTPSYVPPTVTGSASIPSGVAAPLGISTVGGAVGYEWKVTPLFAVAADPAEDLSRVTVSTIGGYSIQQTSIRDAGSAAYRLAHSGVSGTPWDERLLYNETFLVGSAASISFRSRLGYSTPDQSARVEASSDNGATWTAVYTQTHNGSGEASFQSRSASLAAFEGRFVRIRLRYYFNGGSYYPSSISTAGWFIDSISFSGLEAVGSSSIAAASSNGSFSFAAPSAGSYLLAARALLPERTLPFGPDRRFTATVGDSFQVWAGQEEAAASLPAGTLSSAPNGDQNGDGIPNQLAYALGLSPTAGWVNGPTVLTEGGRVRLRYPRHTGRTDVTVVAETSSDLVTWYAIGNPAAPAGFTDAVSTAGSPVEIREASLPAPAAGRAFLRLRSQ